MCCLPRLGFMERRLLVVLPVLLVFAAGPAGALADEGAAGQDVFRLPTLDEAIQSEPGELQGVLLAAAQQFEQGNESVAIEMLARVSRERGEVLIPGSDGRVHPFGQWAAELIHGRGASATDAYRQAVGSQVRMLLEDGPARLAPAELRDLADRFWLTPEGRKATLAEAALHIDAHRFHQAGWLLRRLMESHPDSGANDTDAVLRRVFVLARTGRTAEAAALLDEIKPVVADGDAALFAVVEGVISWAEGQRASARRPALERLDDAEAVSAVLVAPELPMLSPLVQVSDEHQQRPLTRDQLIERWTERPWLANGALVIDESGDEPVLFYRCTIETIRTQAGNSKPDWVSTDRYVRRTSREMNMGTTFLYPRPGSPQRFEERFFFGDPLSRQVTMIGGRLVTLEGQGVINMITSINMHRFTHWFSPAQNALLVLDAEQGRVVARYGLAFRPEPLATVGPEYADHWFDGIAFLSLPVVAGDQLLAAGRQGSDFFLMAFDRTGFIEGAPAREVIRWVRPLPPELQTMSGVGQPIDLLVVDGVVFAMGHNNVVVAMDAEEGRGLWGVRYLPTDIPYVGRGPVADGERVRHLGWSDGFLGVDGDRLFVAPRDSRRLLVIDTARGRLLSSGFPWGEGDQELRLQWVCGLYEGRALVATSDRIMSWDHEAEAPAWIWRSRGRVGRTLQDGRYLYVPVLEDGKSLLVVLDLAAEGRMVRRMPINLPEGHAIMSLHSGEHHLFGWDLNRLWQLAPAGSESTVP